MKIRSIWLALALAAIALPCAAQDRAEACVDTITGNAVMTVALLRDTENRYWPDLADRARYRLSMIGERMGAWQREQKRIPRQLFDFADRVAEVPWLSTCDPWSHRIRFTPRGDDWELRSAGPDGLFATTDDVTGEGMFVRDVLGAGRSHPSAAPPTP